MLFYIFFLFLPKIRIRIFQLLPNKINLKKKIFSLKLTKIQKKNEISQTTLNQNKKIIKINKNLTENKNNVSKNTKKKLIYIILLKKNLIRRVNK